MAPAAAVKAASAAEAGTSARRKTAFLSAMTVPAEGARPNSALTARLGVAASGPVVATERLWCPFGTVFNAARAFTLPAGKLWLCAFAVPA